MESVPPVWLRAIQCGPLELRNRSQACMFGQRTRLCHENVWWTKSKRITTPSCQGRETRLIWWDRIEAWCKFDDAFGVTVGVSRMSAFALTLARACDFISSQCSIPMWLSFDHRSRQVDFFIASLSPTLVRDPTMIELGSTSHNEWYLDLTSRFWSDFVIICTSTTKERAPSSSTFTLVFNTLLIDLNWVNRCFLQGRMRNLATNTKKWIKYRRILWIRIGFCRPSSTYTDFGWFQSLLKNAHVFVSPKVDFVFSGPHPLGFKVCELKT